MPDDKKRGLYGKYLIERTDGQPIKDCIVLEFKDKNARVGIAAWAQAVREDGYTDLSDDVEALLNKYMRGD